MVRAGDTVVPTFASLDFYCGPTGVTFERYSFGFTFHIFCTSVTLISKALFTKLNLEVGNISFLVTSPSWLRVNITM